ncbi:MAG: diguanylate cyclase domain-containing protein [Bacillota bacterium]
MQENYLKKELYEKFKHDSEIFDFLQEAALDGLWYWDLENPENEWMSSKFWRTLGFNPSEKKHASSEWQDLIHPEDLKVAKLNIKRHLEDPEYPYDQITRYIHKNGSTVWIRCRGFAIRDQEGKPLRMIGAHMDVSGIMRSNQRIKHLKNEYETVFNGTQDALFLIDVRGPRYFRYIRNNESHQQKTGITQSMIEGKTPVELLGEKAAEPVVDHYQSCVDAKDIVSYEETLDLLSGRRIWHTTLTPIIENNKVVHVVGSAVDITERKALEKELSHRANYDALTGLVNRDYLTQIMEDKTADLNGHFAFIFIDLDDFKPVNDTYGHLAGDRVLKVTADRLLKATEGKDVVARLGGDEFVIVKCDLSTPAAIEAFEKTLAKAIAKSVYYDGHQLQVHASIGHAIFPLDGLDYDQLSLKADAAMYSVKKQSK